MNTRGNGPEKRGGGEFPVMAYLHKHGLASDRSSVCDDGRDERMAATHIHVQVQNFAHLRFIYGEALGGTVMRTLQWRACAVGSFADSGITTHGDDGFLISLRAFFAQKTAGIPSLLESLLLALTDGPIGDDGVEVLPVVSIGYAVLETADASRLPIVYRLRAAAVLSIPPIQHTREWRAAYVHDMALAVLFFHLLVKNGVRLLFQPIVSRNNPDVVLYQEALLRFSETVAIDDAVACGNILTSMERLGLMRLVDRCVLHAVLDRLSEQPTLILGCNLSAQSFVGDVWWDAAFARLAAQPGLASRLTVELTETAVLTDLTAAVSFAAQLRSFGCRVAVDDLGTGFSNLEFVLLAKPDVIKIDRYFLYLARSGQTGAATLQHLVQLCALLAPDVVVEGVEYAEDLVILGEVGAPWLQGYLTGAPGKGVASAPFELRWG